MKKYTYLLLSLAFLIMGCNSSTISSGTPTPSTRLLVAASPAGQIRLTHFTTLDHIQLTGLIYGQGKTMVICTHMAGTTKSVWIDSGVPQRLASLGYSVLAFDFRGNGDSQGEDDPSTIDVDLRGAITFAQQQGATSIVLMGASMGGTAALKVASEVPVTAVISLSAPQTYGVQVTNNELQTMKIPKLFLASTDDTFFALDANHMYEVASDPKEIKIYPGIAHGTAILFGGPDSDPAKLILGFIQQHAPAK
jgi:alpha/beta superfamily hydrolase